MSISKNFLLSTFTFCVLSAPLLAQGISVELDGRSLNFDQPPAMMGGRLLVPLRGIFEALKADVVYDGPTRSIQATKGSRVVQLQLGSRTAIIDGRTLFLDVPADTIGGRTMVPLRFVSEALGADVKWEGATKTVKLSSTGQDTTAVSPAPPKPSPPVSSGPRIERVFHNGTTILKPGSQLDVVLYGEPGGQATFEILGATKQISMTEVSTGRYQVRWTIPNGLEVEKGVLLSHLRKNGRETALEAQRQVTVQAANVSAPTTPPRWVVSPADGAKIAQNRPSLSLTFPNPVQPTSLRFFVDGIDFTNQAILNGSQLSWKPVYDLSQATHQAEVEAMTQQGEKLSYSWKFTIDPTAAQNNNPASGFSVSEVRPAANKTVGSRPQVGAVFNRRLRSLSFYVDNRLITNQAGVQRLTNGILWTPSYDLATGQHRATVQAVDENGQVLKHNWTFLVQNTNISNFRVEPATLAPGQQMRVTLQGPAGASGVFSVGSSGDYSLREISPGNYQGLYSVKAADSGQRVSARLRLQNGQVVQLTSPTPVTVRNQGELTVSNLKSGMTISPVFNVQGNGTAGRQISVLVEYASGSIIGQLAGQLKQISTSAIVRANGSYDVPVDASVVRAGQQFRVTVSDGVSQPIKLVMTRR